MLFAALDRDARSFLLARSRRMQFAANQIIQQRGDHPHGVWLIERGAVTVGRFLPSGEFRGLALLGEGDSYGELALLANRPRAVDAIARHSTTMRFIPARAFFGLIEINPQAMQSMLGALARQLQELLDQIAGIRRGTSVARTAGLLANLAPGNWPTETRIEISQQEVADLQGMTRATANKALAALETRGLIKRGYGKIEVLRLDELRLAAVD